MILSFDMQYMIYIWLGVAIIALVIEALTTDLTSIWASVAGFITMIISIFLKVLWAQIIIFAVIMVLLIILLRPVVRKYFKQNEIKTNVDSIIGKLGMVTEEIMPNEKGTVKIAGKEWTAISNDGTLITINTKVEVLAIEGVKLIVKASKEKN